MAAGPRPPLPRATVITPFFGEVSVHTHFSVITATFVSLAATQAKNPSIPAGTSQQFGATGTFSDSTMQDMTSSVTWSSSTVAVTTISNAVGNCGVAAPVALGTTQITVTVSVSLPAPGASRLRPHSPYQGGANGSPCSSAMSPGYFKKPCVSVTDCNSLQLPGAQRHPTRYRKLWTAHLSVAAWHSFI